MIEIYRRKKLRVYVQTLQQKFVNAKNMRDYGKSIVWPAPPAPLRNITGLLRSACNRWRAYMILSKIPRKEWPQLKIKISAASVLKNKRPTWGQTRQWQGNYLATHDENNNYTTFNDSVNNLRNSQHFGSVLFSSFVTKFNKFNKCAERVLLLTDQYIYKLDNLKFKNMKEGVAVGEITALSVSPGQDQLIVFHCPKGNDLVISLHNNTQEDRIGELVGLVCNLYER